MNKDQWIRQQMENLSPEVAYKFFSSYIDRPEFAEAKAALNKAVLLPGVTPEFLVDQFSKWSDRDGLDFTDEIRAFTLKAMQHYQFIAQVRAGTYEGDK